jgi:tetratricopeptide (TPR) repeat protein
MLRAARSIAQSVCQLFVSVPSAAGRDGIASPNLRGGNRRRRIGAFVAVAVVGSLCSPVLGQQRGSGGHGAGQGNFPGQGGNFNRPQWGGQGRPGPMQPPVNAGQASPFGLQLGRALMTGANTAVLNGLSAIQIDNVLSYWPDPQISAQVRATMIATISANNPAARPTLEQNFANDAALREYERFVGAHGYSSRNVADAMAALLWSSWQIANSVTLSDAQIRGIHQQARAIFIGTSELSAVPMTVRQQFTETVAYLVVMVEAAKRQQASDPATFAIARQIATTGVKSIIGVDLADLEVTADGGFRAKRAAPPLPTGPAANSPGAAVQNPPAVNPDAKACEDDLSKDFSRRIDACARVIAANPGNDAVLLAGHGKRGSLYGEARQFDRMMADFDEVVRIAPQNPLVYVVRAGGLIMRRDYDRALADVEKALTLQQNTAEAYAIRGNIYLRRVNYDRAMADSTKAIGIKPDVGMAWAVRALAQLEQGNAAAALTDLNEAIRLEPRDENYRLLRAEIWFRQGQTADAQAEIDRLQGWNPRSIGVQLMRGRMALAQGRTEVALGEMTQVIEQDDQQLFAFASRAAAYERAGRSDLALADYRRVLTLTPDDKMDRDAQATARDRVAALTAAAANAPAGGTLSAAAAAPPGRRIALVIGMGAYVNVPALRNPVADARAVADMFRRLGFAEVIEHEDLTRAKLEETLKDFGDKAGEADWAVIYYAGHGVEMNGVNYLVPVDAKFARADHVEDEAVTLTRVLSKAEAAHKLRMVILDACRNNPFRMAAAEGRTRSIGRGLSAVEPARGVLVAYAARDGTTADDGDSEHSPFTQALLTNLETPGVDIRIMFSKVRDQVLLRTNNVQEPFTYGSLPGQEFYFREATR